MFIFGGLLEMNLLGKEIGYRGIKLIWKYCVKFLKCIGVIKVLRKVMVNV